MVLIIHLLDTPEECALPINGQPVSEAPATGTQAARNTFAYVQVYVRELLSGNLLPSRSTLKSYTDSSTSRYGSRERATAFFTSLSLTYRTLQQVASDEVEYTGVPDNILCRQLVLGRRPPILVVWRPYQIVTAVNASWNPLQPLTWLSKLLIWPPLARACITHNT